MIINVLYLVILLLITIELGVIFHLLKLTAIERDRNKTDKRINDLIERFFTKLKATEDMFKKHETDAGFDIFATENTIIPAKGANAVSTNLKVAIPKGCVGIVKSRSGLAFKHNLHVGAGVIDAEYRGEVKVLLYNFSDEDYALKKGEKIAQMIIIPINIAGYEKVLDVELDKTERGEKGFGSTGK